MLWIHDISPISVARALREDVGDTVAVPEVPAMSEATLMLLEFYQATEALQHSCQALTEALESKEVDLPKVSTLEISIKVRGDGTFV